MSGWLALVAAGLLEIAWAFGLKYSDGPTLRPGGGGFAFIDAPEGYEIELIEMPKSKELA